MEELSQIRQKIYRLNQKRWKLLESVMGSGKLLTASFYESALRYSGEYKIGFYRLSETYT
jgi:hypothetical protein